MKHNSMKRILSMLLVMVIVITGFSGTTAYASDFGLTGGIDWWDSGESSGTTASDTESEYTITPEGSGTADEADTTPAANGEEQEQETEGADTDAQGDGAGADEAVQGDGEASVSLGYSGTGTYGESMSFVIPWDKGGRARAGEFANLSIQWKSGYDYNFPIAPGYPIYGQWCVYYADGQMVYCMEPKNLVSSDGKLLASSTSWSAYSSDQQKIMGYAYHYGNKNGSNVPEHIATQAIIWEICLGYRNLNTFERSGNYIYNGLISGRAAESYYNDIVQKIQTHVVISSFMSVEESKAPTHKLESQGDGTYKLEITDSKGVLADFTLPTISGVTFTKNGNKLTIVSTQPIDPAALVECNKGGGSSGSSGGNWIFWLANDNSKEQIKGHWSGGVDPVAGYFKITTGDAPPEEEIPEEYKIRIVKRVEGTGELLAGAEFEIRHTAHGVVGTYVTDSSGTLEVTVPWPGTYIVTEIACPAGFVMPADPDAELYVDTDNPIAERTFYNIPYTGVEIQKIDSVTGKPLAGAVIKIWGISNGLTRTGTSGSDGIVQFLNLPGGDYAVQEIQAPDTHVLNPTVFPVHLEPNQLASVTIRNDQKEGLKILKVDPEGNPLQGAVFRISKPDGEVVGEYVTDANGLIYHGSLSDGVYRVEEIQAPAGHLIPDDPDDYIKYIEIITSTSQKDHQLVFTNVKKPSLTIKKVDASDPSKLLFGATFRIARQGGSETWDITTDRSGIARLEGLEPGIVYECTEIISPAGYLPPTFHTTIMLTPGEEHTITVENNEAPKLTISKIDEDTGVPLAGAVFRVTYNNGSSYEDVTTGDDGKATITGLPEGWITILETKSPEGWLLDDTPIQKYMEPGSNLTVIVKNKAVPFLKIVKEDSLTGTRLAGAVFRITRKDDSGETLVGEFTTDEQGEITIEVEPGRFLCEEIKAPNGFLIDTTVKEITVEYGKITVVTFENTAEQPIVIQKVDPDGTPLSGAVFRVTTASGEFVAEVTTGRNGMAVVPADPGYFVVTEVRSPSGYILSAKPVTIELKPGKPAQVEFVNYKAPGFTLLKLDSESRQPVMGARFKITTTSGALIGEYETDIHGRIHLEAIDSDSQAIVVVEILAADGYLIDDTPHTVQLTPGGTAELTLYNKSKPGLQIRKVDSETLLPVSDCVFNVQQLVNGAKKDLGNFTSGTNGLIYIPNLSEGYVEITEIKAKTGYLLDPTPQTVFVEAGKLNTVEFRNQPYSKVVIRKVDENGKPLAGAIFRIYDEYRIEIGSFESSALGEIVLDELTVKTIYVQEVKAPSGFVLDSTVHKVELQAGKTVTIQVKNIEMGSLRLLKRCAESGKPLQGVTFLIYDAKNNIIGEYKTDQNGLIVLPSNIPPQKIRIREIATIDGYVLNDKELFVEIKAGETTEITIDNEPERGRIQIVKKAEEYNPITKDKQGALLEGAVFEILSEDKEVVDTITTDKNGLATSDLLPLGRYAIREKESPSYYISLDAVFYAEIKVHGDRVEFEVLNKPVIPEVSVEKRGNVEALPGDSIRYDFSNIQNLSNVALDEFYWHDALPTDAVRLEKIFTGTWNERLVYTVEYRTNLKTTYRVLEKGLHTNVNNEIDCSPSRLGLAANEYITDFRFQFGTVKEGFREEEAPFIFVKVLDDLPNGYQFTNKTDVGGRLDKEWVIDKDAWVTIIYRTEITKRDLPRTGY